VLIHAKSVVVTVSKHNYYCYYNNRASTALGKTTCFGQIGRSKVQSQLVPLESFIDIKSFRSHYGPGVNSASNRNEYQEYFLGVKTAGA